MKIVWSLKDPSSGWSEVLQMAYKEDYPVQTSVTFLPMIDLSPYDPSRIYSTILLNNVVCYMQWSCKQAFNQPLYWKCFQIRAPPRWLRGRAFASYAGDRLFKGKNVIDCLRDWYSLLWNFRICDEILCKWKNSDIVKTVSWNGRHS